MKVNSPMSIIRTGIHSLGANVDQIQVSPDTSPTLEKYIEEIKNPIIYTQAKDEGDSVKIKKQIQMIE